MNKKIAKEILEKFSSYAEKEELSLFIVGSLGYKNAYQDENKLEMCDDIDCIFIYNDINSLNNFEFLSSKFLNEAKKLLLNNKIDMFSNKFYIEGIQISADYISKKYLQKLLEEKIENIDKFRKKLTDSVEKNKNMYCNIFGEMTTYIKSYEELNEYRVYKLPIHLFINQKFYPGVLLNKFLYNPICLINNGKDKDLIKEIFNQINMYCQSQGNGASIYNTFYKKENLLKEEKLNLGWKE